MVECLTRTFLKLSVALPFKNRNGGYDLSLQKIRGFIKAGVMENEYILLSASQMTTSSLCRRKWGFQYIDEIKSPMTDALQEGLDLHKVAEDWLRDNKVPDIDTKAGKLFLAGMNLLPVPDPALLVEEGFVFVDGPLRWRGFIDLIDPRRKPPRMTDHKTTGNLWWAKTEHQLFTDPQAILYAKYMMDRFNVRTVDGQWVYFQKGKKPIAKEVLFELRKPDVESEYQKLRAIGHELLELKNTFDTGLNIPVEEFPHKGCKAFGGCYFKDICSELSEAKGSADMSSLLEKLKRMGDNGKERKDNLADAAIMAGMINPPKTAEATKQAEGPKEPQPIQEPPTEDDGGMQMESVEVPKRKRGRPKGSKTKKAKAKVEAPVEAPVEEPKPVIENTEEIEAVVVGDPNGPMYIEPTPDTAQGYTLYINCMPMSGSKNIADIVAEAAMYVCKEHGVEHYRLIDYGKAPAHLCVALRKMLDGEPLVGAYTADTGNQMVNDTLAVLMEGAVDIVRAVR